MSEDFRIITNAEGYRIPYHVIKILVQQDKAHLIIPDSVAEFITASVVKGPKVTTYSFINLIAALIIAISIYLSFTQAWYCFLIGFLIAHFIYKNNTLGDTKNFVATALNNEDFYNLVMERKSWQYEVKPDVLESLKQWKNTAA